MEFDSAMKTGTTRRLDLSTYFPNYVMAATHWLRVASGSAAVDQDGLRFTLFGSAAPSAFAAASPPGLSQAIDYYAWASDAIYTLGADGSNGQVRMRFGPWLRTYRRWIRVPEDLPIRESFVAVASLARYIGDIGHGMQGSIPVYEPAGQVIQQFNVTTDWAAPDATSPPHIYGKTEWFSAPTFALTAFEEFWLGDDVPVLDTSGAQVGVAPGLRAFRHVDIGPGLDPPPMVRFVWEPLTA
jgi:hypothetical protein